MPSSKKKRLQPPDGGERSTSDEPPTKKKKKEAALNHADICKEVYEAIRSKKAVDGHLLCEVFIRVPSRRTEPDYYEVVESPMDLMKIQNKLKNEEYSDIDQLTEDFQQLVANAQKYYEANSKEHSDATNLLSVFEEVKAAAISRQLPDTGRTIKEETPEPSQGSDGNKNGNGDEQDSLFIDTDTKTTDDADDGDGEDDDGDDTGSEEPTQRILRRSKREVVALGDDEAKRPLHLSLRPKEPTNFRSLVLSIKRVKPNNKDDSVSRDDQSSSVADDDRETYEEMLGALLDIKEADRRVCEMFKVLPPSENLPQYYEMIKEPMDLKTIAQKVQKNEYTSLEEMVKDIRLMLHNAKKFNEPGSQIYKDAGTLLKLVNEKKTELSQPRTATPVSPRRGRPRIHPLPKPSELLVKARYQEKVLLPTMVETESVKTQGETCDDSETEGSVMDSATSPFWALFNTVRCRADALGNKICEPFLRLPNKRMYPDYYEEIKKPISLLKIQTRIKAYKYKGLEQLYCDLTRVFNNARQYNVDESKIHQDAVSLQTVTDEKYKEIMSKEESAHEVLPLAVKKNKRWEETSSLASMTSEEGNCTPKRKPGRKSSLEDPLKRRLWTIFKIVYDYQFDGRHLIEVFKSLPSRKDYPDYYQVVSEPIDMGMIENKIKMDRYVSDQQLIEDLELMFRNAKHYNEEISQIYRDADTLERTLRTRVRNLPPLEASPMCAGSRGPRISDVLTAKLYDLYNTIKDHTDLKGRILSTPFMKLPQKAELPDYYEVIRKPVDMMRISQRLATNQYTSLEELAAECVLMFENACKYNEPDSLIYKDALTLQRVCMERKQELGETDDSSAVPDVRAALQEIMMTVYIAVISYTDEEGRCLSDSFLELPLFTEGDGEAGKKALTFQQIKRNLTKGCYRRIDRFQDDMLQVFEHARSVSRTDSQLYEDSVDLAMYYLKVRDEVCHNGEVLLTPALSYTDKMLMGAVEKEKREKSEKEQAEDEVRIKTEEEEKPPALETQGSVVMESYNHNGLTFETGNFVYIESREPDLDNHIVLIEKLWMNDEGEAWLRGIYFFRSQETFHLASKKFLEKEVFKSDKTDNIPFMKVQGKCYVMSVRDYYRYKPENYPDKDVYVCESRYSSRLRQFKKLKQWHPPRPDSVVLTTRATPLTPARVASVFAETKDTDSDAGSCVSAEFLDKIREVVETDRPPDGQDGCQYYEQLCMHCGWLKLGDYVYMPSQTEKPFIMRIEKIWRDAQGNIFFYGTFFLQPSQTEHAPTRTFYEREVLKSSVECAQSGAQALGRCCVLSYKEYASCRPTEVPEEHVYMCEAKYIESERIIKKFKQPSALLKTNGLSIRVCDDEVYFFKKNITPKKVSSPFLLESTKAGLDDPFNDSFYDPNNSSFTNEFPAGFHGDDSLSASFNTPAATPNKSHKKKGGRKVISAYSIFSSDVRKQIMSGEHKLSFGEVSKLVGITWKDLPKDKKEVYEAMARKLQAEIKIKQQNKILQQAAEAQMKQQQQLGTAQSPPPNSASPYVQASGSGATSGQMMMGAASPAPSQSVAGYQPQGFSSPNYQQPQQTGQQMPYPVQVGTPQPAPNSGSLSSQSTMSGTAAHSQMAPPPKPPSPQFVTVPPRTQKLMHSEAYLRYIENLNKEKEYLSDWRRTLSARQDNLGPIDQSRLPNHWLGPGYHQDSAINALWSLRDLMMRDTLMISRTLDYTEL